MTVVLHRFTGRADAVLAVSRAHAILDGEYGATRAIFDAGYTIDCPLLAYQGVDWRNRSNWQCNKHLHPVSRARA